MIAGVGSHFDTHYEYYIGRGGTNPRWASADTMRTPPLLPVVFVSAAFGVAGCDYPTACLMNIEPAIEVEVRDAATGGPAATGARGTVTDGDFVDSLRLSRRDDSGWFSMRAADERPGTYDVRLENPSYKTWERSGVRVRDGECHVRTVQLEARLEPSPE